MRHSSPSKPFTLSKQRQQDILRKLDQSNIKTEEEFKKILHNLEQQNVRLRDELKVAGQKVIKLLEKKKIAKNENNQAVESQILKRKNELQAKYKEFDQFKKEVYEASSKKDDPIIKEQLTKFQSLIKQCDKQLKILREERRLADVANKQLNAALSQYSREEMPDKDRIEILVKENKQLRRKAYNDMKRDEEIDHEAIKVQQSLVSLQQRYRKAQNQKKIPKSIRSLKTIELDKSQMINTTLMQQINDLRLKKNQIIDKDQKKQQELSNKKSSLGQVIQGQMNRLKKLEVDRVKLIQEYNKYQNYAQGWKKIKLTSEAETQTDSVGNTNLYRLRRDYAGIIGKNRFDDRTNVLLSNFNCRVHKMTVFENQRGLVTIKFEYFDANDWKSQFEGSAIVPQSYLSRCKHKTIEVEPPNFFKLFKIKTSEKRIKKIQVVTNSSQSQQFGQRRPFDSFQKDDAVYAFDITTGQFPASMFGSCGYVGTEWHLEGLGAEIRDIKEKIQ